MLNRDRNRAEESRSTYLNQHILHTRFDAFGERLVYRSLRSRNPLLKLMLRLLSIDFQPGAEVGPGLRLLHVGHGHLVHFGARLGADVVLGPNCLVGAKADLWGPGAAESTIIVEDHVIVGAGAAIMCRGNATIRIGEGSVIGVNAVVTKDTGPWEIWAGNPARKVGMRPRSDAGG